MRQSDMLNKKIVFSNKYEDRTNSLYLCCDHQVLTLHPLQPVTVWHCCFYRCKTCVLQILVRYYHRVTVKLTNLSSYACIVMVYKILNLKICEIIPGVFSHKYICLLAHIYGLLLNNVLQSIE